MSAKAEARDLAYNTWRECGQNLSETERRLNRDHGLPVTRQTLAEWRRKYDWEGRAARTEAAIAEREEVTGEETILTSLLQQKAHYEEYFATLPRGKVDNQALYAYSGLLKTLVELRQSMADRSIRKLKEELPKLIADFAGKPKKDALEGLVNLAIAVATIGLADGSVPVKIDLAKLIKAIPENTQADKGVSESGDNKPDGNSVPDAETIRRIREQFL